MSYKRKAHVLFVGSGDLCRAMMAAAFANSLGQRYMEARAAALYHGPLAPELLGAMREAGVEIADQILHPFDASNLAWADLVVTLDEAADRACPVLPEWVQKRCYPFAHPDNLDSLRRARDAIKQRVEGMIGGMAMIA
jgi:protein-tyrosine-phosphatase